MTNLPQPSTGNTADAFDYDSFLGRVATRWGTTPTPSQTQAQPSLDPLARYWQVVGGPGMNSGTPGLPNYGGAPGVSPRTLGSMVGNIPNPALNNAAGTGFSGAGTSPTAPFAPEPYARPEGFHPDVYNNNPMGTVW